MKTSLMTEPASCHVSLAGYKSMMNTALTMTSKQILADPVLAYSRLSPEAPLDKQQQLATLSSQMSALKKNLNEIQLQSKKLSRKIGEAKRNNQDIAPLKQQMQSLGQQLKSIKQHYADHEQKVLSFFTGLTENTEGHQEINTPEHIIHNKKNPRSQCKTAEPFHDIDSINIKRLTVEHREWNNYVNQHPDGCIHHLSEWTGLFQQSYGHEYHYYFAHDKNNRIVGILPLIRLKSVLFGDLLVSMPFFQHAGAIADQPSIEQKLIAHANRAAARLGVKHIEYRDDICRDGMPAQTHKVNMVLTLPGCSETLWQSFSSKLRAQIKRPQRERPEIKTGHKELLNDFYAVYARNMRDLGSPLHSKKFIANILDQFPDNSWLVVLRLKGKPVSAGLLLGYGNTMEIPLASTIRDVNHLSINMLMYWQILQLAIAKGYQKFDFGRSTKNAGTYNFKKQWGAIAKPLYWHYWLNDSNELPGLNPDNPKFALVIFLWKRLPVIISKWLGPHIIKNIP